MSLIRNQLQRITNQVKSLSQNVMRTPREVRIKEYFPEDNTVTVQFINSGSEVGGATPPGVNGDHRFLFGYRGDGAEGLAPQPGDKGYLFFTGSQYKSGFVMLSHSPGGSESFSYVPIRGNWSI